MFSLSIWVYLGLAIAIFGSLATVWGPGVKDPVIRTINTEVASVGVSLVLLTYNSTLALLTLIATTIVTSLILFRAIARLEEIGADV
ncbi:EhaE family protein [uncultured Methanobrevibacter sp.]|uniref:EhaE family protein n=1 Tax=uncultured Methanobrevibacter sp. TaxID=253161 RepID=UPI002615F196